MTAPSALTHHDDHEHTAPARALSPAERWYWIIDQLSTLNVCARVRIKGDLTPAALRTALGALQERHPQLRVAIADTSAHHTGGGPYFVPTDAPIPLREVRADGHEQQRWVREVDGHELTAPLDTRRGPLARAVLITAPDHTHDLLLTVAHCIADGTTALSLLRQWVRLATTAPHPAPGRDAGAATAAAAAAPAHGLAEPFEALFPPRPPAAPPAPSHAPTPDDAGAAAGAGAGEGSVGRLEPERFVPFGRRRTRMLHRSLSGDDLQSLTLACKREGTTLHGVLAAALACAVARDAGAAPTASFAVGSPVSLRQELRRAVSEDEAGCFVSALHSVVRYQPDHIWSMARFINDDIAARKKLGEQYEVFDLLAAQGPSTVADSEPFVRHFEEHGPFNFFVSNIGRFDFPAQLGAWQLSGAQFVGGISVVGCLGSSVTTSQGRLAWNFTYIDEAVSPERAERLADDTIHTLIAASR
ncbi:condensation domain-containing protein [Streptomyces sp. NPDC052687]|uniref:condensation domain-containing protein n=1 Tax=Streptomyces sp. NPDC052687 TaxID=3154759 RepID=UPI003427C690